MQVYLGKKWGEVSERVKLKSFYPFEGSLMGALIIYFV